MRRDAPILLCHGERVLRVSACGGNSVSSLGLAKPKQILSIAATLVALSIAAMLLVG
jgi:hypothetical protein